MGKVSKDFCEELHRERLSTLFTVSILAGSARGNWGAMGFVSSYWLKWAPYSSREVPQL
jgi:hypothetical protein